jgi:uncharacterized damage-inducible protein DinB
VPDHRPPRASGERDVVTALLQYQRESLLRKLDGADLAAARWSPVGTGTSLLWLVKHMAHAELLWVAVRFAGLDRELPDGTVRDDDTVESAAAGYRAATAEADELIAAASLDDPCQRVPGDEPLPLRWVVAHLLEETARHAGHADILRELIDGSTGR